MSDYYNEIDEYAAQWIRNLITAGHLAPGDVDERSISDVRPSDLVGYTQCHFFAGIGGWPLALKLAGWSADRPVWTGSCPCQPFSVAGQGAGVADERHLWPHWFHLIRAVRPPTVFGEQVEAAVNHGWLDLVQDDLEGEGYAFAPVGIPAAGVGAPHIRQRLWFVADSVGQRRVGQHPLLRTQDEGWVGEEAVLEVAGGRESDQLDHHHHQGLEGLGSGHQAEGRRLGEIRPVISSGEPVRLEHSKSDGWFERWAESSRRSVTCGRSVVQDRGTGPTNGFWRDADWLLCRDGKWRPVEPGTFPLAHGVSNRVGRLRAYGNAIVPQVAAEVIRAYMECRPC